MSYLDQAFIRLNGKKLCKYNIFEGNDSEIKREPTFYLKEIPEYDYV